MNRIDEIYGVVEELGPSNEFCNVVENLSNSKEFFTEPKEFGEEAREEFRLSSKTAEKQKNKKMRKMVYAVTAAVATVSISMTAMPSMESKLIPANEYEKIAFSAGGVIPAKEGIDQWVLLNMKGEEIFAPSIMDITSFPNQNGKIGVEILFNHYVVDNEGDICWHYGDKEIDEIYYNNSGNYDRIGASLIVSDNDMIYYNPKRYEEQVTYYSAQDDIIFDDIRPLHPVDSFPFSDGVAVVLEQSDIRDDDKIWLLYPDGSKECVVQDTSVDRIEDGYSEGYFIYFSEGDYVFYNPITKDEKRIPHNSQDILTLYFGEEYPVIHNNSLNNTYNWFDYVLRFGEGSSHFKKYYKNGTMLGHVGSYACLAYYHTGETKERKDVLIDVLQITESNPYGIVAVYDELIFDNSKYLLAKEKEQFFYVDFDGNKVSDVYDKATSFSEQGYALVSDEKQRVYVIDEEFNEVEQLEKVTDFTSQAYGDVFEVFCGEDKFIYYYGKKK